MASEKMQPLVSKSRMVNLSDGLFSIVLTLLVFRLMTPLVLDAETANDLHSALLGLWPRFVSFTISFVVISIYWVWHHSYYHAVQVINENQVWLNFLFLFCVSLLPFSAELIAEHHKIRIAGIIYGLNITVATSVLGLNWWYASSRDLLSPDVDRKAIRQIHSRVGFHLITSLFVVVVACFSPLVAFYLYVINAFGYLALQLFVRPLQKLKKPDQ
jgi:uncharacterized membrane protein